MYNKMYYYIKNAVLCYVEHIVILVSIEQPEF